MPDKVRNRFNIQFIATAIFLIASLPALHAQQEIRVVRKISDYRKTVLADSSKKMVELKTIIPSIRYDLRYATRNNFMHARLYKDHNIALVRLPVAKALATVQQELAERGLCLKIWDAYRPYRITVSMWKAIKDDRYVADPKKGSGHNRGIAVDLTIVDNITGAEWDMGTRFDDFSDTAHQDFMSLPATILRHRSLLKAVMEKNGFRPLETEWWHFYWNDSSFEVLDVAPRKMKDSNS